MGAFQYVQGKPNRTADWVFSVTVDGEEQASGFGTRRQYVEQEAMRYGRAYQSEGVCVVTVRPPKGWRP